MFTTLDWTIIGGYLVLAFAVGAMMMRAAGRGLDAYFVADRSLPWWWLGTSMVATTFASDTPLAITGIVARDGIAGNWFWWSQALTFVTVAAFFAHKWRQSRVLTDVELIELRYAGPSAALLRAFKAFFFSVVINGIVLGWVFKGMSKITAPFIHWGELLGPRAWNAIEGAWPQALVLGDINNTFTVLVIFLIVVIYSSMGGIRGVILTDLFQFALAMVTSVLFAWLALRSVGGVHGLLDNLHELYPQKAPAMLSFWPRFEDAVLPLQVFLIFIFIQSWATYMSDGSGYLAQRINTARTPEDARAGTLWFTLLHFGLRTWPWIVIALVALVVFPLDDPTRSLAAGAAVANDREAAYPVLMKVLLPPGLLGLTFASLMAAFMSTVDTHINWGASYLTNDLYKRFIRPNAGPRQLVRASRAAVVLMSVVAVVVATRIDSIGKAWKFFVALSAGLGLPHLLRWVWWRANAWTEIAGMTAAFVLALVLYAAFPEARPEYLLFWIALASVAAALLATWITRPVDEQTLQRFVERVQPFGFWPERFGRTRRLQSGRRLLGHWLLMLTATTAGTFGIGYLVLAQPAKGAALLAVFAVALGLYLCRRGVAEEEPAA